MFPTHSSFGTGYRERPNGLSHIEHTLKPGVLGQPVGKTSFEVSGQWLVCFAGASSTEDPSSLIFCIRQIQNCVKSTNSLRSQKPTLSCLQPLKQLKATSKNVMAAKVFRGNIT